MKKIINIIIILIVIALYIFTSMFIYTSFRERKRQEVSKKIINKVDEQIKKINGDTTVTEAPISYNGYKYTVLGKLSIKKINFYQAILKENNYGSYNTSVVKMSGPDLNTPGNVAIGGHNYMQSSFFIRINRLVKNDEVVVTDLSGKSVKYYVYEYGVTSDMDATYLKQPDDDSMIVTLVTCTISGKERYYVKAKAR